MCAPGARAESVLVRQTPGLRDGLCAALRIQLTGAAEVRCELEPLAAQLSARLADAARRAGEAGATVGVILERDPDPHLVRMYLVGTLPGAALIAIERIEDRADADVDRSLALKVQSALLALASAPVKAPDSPLVRALAPVRAVPQRRWLLLAEAGALLSVGALARPRFGGGAGLGVRVARGKHFGELLLDGRMLARTHTRERGSALRIDEWGAALEARAGRRLGALSLGGLLAVGAERVHARAVARDGSVGGVRLGVARIAVGLDLRVRLLRGAALRLAPALELYPVRHRLVVDEEPLGTLTRVRLGLPLSLLVALPFDGAEADDAR